MADIWKQRVEAAKAPPKKRGPKPGVKVGKPRGPAKAKKKPVIIPMSMGMIVLSMWRE
jgi:hypothetical protein